MDSEKTVLLVDDDPDFAANLKDIFEEHGFQIEVAGTGSAGIQAVKRSHYELLLLDLRLPDMSGIETMRQIKSDAPDIEVIVQTGYGALETAVQALEMGAFAYVNKPVDPGQLMNLVKRAVERAELRQALRRSEENYRTCFEKSHDIILVADMDGRILDINPAAISLYGYTLEELRALPLGGLVAPEYRGPMKKSIEQLQRDGDAVFETAHECRDGSVIYLEASSSTIEYEGKPAVLNHLRDTTERKQAEKALEESEERYRTIFENTGTATVIVEDDTTISLANAESTKLYGYSKEELEGKKSWTDFVHPEDLEKVMGYHHLRRLDPAAVPKGYEYGMINRSGEIRHVAVFAELIPGTRRSIASLLDITESKKAKEELQRANTELEGFAGTVSHDLRGPLANIEMASTTLMELLAAPQTDQTRSVASQVAEMLQKSSERSMNLVEKLLGLAEAGQAPKEVASIDVREVVERVLEERAIDMEEKGIRVGIGADIGQVIANPTHVYQVFTNLIGNAIQHSDSQMPVIEVSHLGDDGRGGHRYLVRDNGSGIPPDSIDKLFIPFFKGKAGGTGIGLAIVEKTIKVYGGSIRAYNDNGACFEFILRDFAE